MDVIDLDPGKLYLIGLVATVVAQAIKIIYARLGKDVSKRLITIIAFVISVILAAIWYRPELPSPVDPMEFALALISAATTVLGAAVAIYNVLLEKLLQLLGQALNILLEP